MENGEVNVNASCLEATEQCLTKSHADYVCSPKTQLLISHDNLQEACGMRHEAGTGEGGNRCQRKYFMALAMGHESAQLSTLNRQQKQKAQVEGAVRRRGTQLLWL